MNKRALFLVLFLSIVFIANNVAFAAVNGQCGPVDGNFYREPFSPSAASLCSSGTPSSISGSGPWSWTCRGIDGGNDDHCSAQKTSVSSALCCCTPVSGQCGSSNNGTFSSAPTYNLCSSGTPSSVSGNGPWYWSCSGKNGGATVSCSANKTQPVINGQCGSSNGATLYSAPTSNLCSSGSTSSVSGNGPWNWTCLGQNGGTSASCSAYKAQISTNGSCGSSNGGSFTNTPTSNLCSAGTASYVSGSGPWNWTCYGENNGSNAYCSAYKVQTSINGSCGSSNGGTFSSIPTSNLCSAGTASYVSGSGPWNWTCYGQDGGSNAYCSAYKSQTSTHGQCGSSNGGTFYNAPTYNLCSSGNASSVSGSGPWNWTCYGYDGGSNAYCNAYKTQQMNNNPTVNAGSDKEINAGQSMYLYATAYDPDGDYLTYSWSCTGGSLSSYNSLNPIFYAPSYSYYNYNYNYSNNYTCTLTVNDNRGGSASDSLNIIVRSSGTGNRQPYVDAGYNREVQPGQSIYLNATASDPDGDYLTYSWSCTGGSLSSYNSLNPIFYAPSSSYYNSYTCTLTVNDNRGGSASDSVNISTGTSYYGNLSVSTNLASNITTASARLNGYLFDDGGENTSVRFVWGRSNNFNNYTSWIDYKRTGSYFYSDIYGLEKGKVYQFRAEARNGRSNVYGSTLKFITKPDDPYNFDALALNSQIQLSWGVGQGACNTAITRKTSGYPISISDGTLVYYGSGSSFVDSNVYGGINYYYRAWSIACDEGMYAVSDSLYAKDYAAISQPITYTPPKVVVQQTADLSIDVVGRNLTPDESSCPIETSSWKDSITAQPGDEIEVMITVSASSGNAENVILTNALPAKIDEVYDLEIEGQTAYGDANGSFILGTILNGKSKTIIFKARLNKDESFAYGATDLINTVEVNAKNVETARDSLAIRVSRGVGEEAMGGLEGFISRNWKIFYIFLGLILGLLFFLLAYFFFQEQEKRRRAKKEDVVLEKSKYFHIQ